MEVIVAWVLVWIFIILSLFGFAWYIWGDQMSKIPLFGKALEPLGNLPRTSLIGLAVCLVFFFLIGVPGIDVMAGADYAVALGTFFNFIAVGMCILYYFRVKDDPLPPDEEED